MTRFVNVSFGFDSTHTICFKCKQRKGDFKMVILKVGMILTAALLQLVCAQQVLSIDEDVLFLSVAMREGRDYNSKFIHSFTGDTLQRHF